jgi:hypothetical protein
MHVRACAAKLMRQPGYLRAITTSQAGANLRIQLAAVIKITARKVRGEFGVIAGHFMECGQIDRRRRPGGRRLVQPKLRYVPGFR